MIQNQPKTVEDYKDVVKILKLKIIKQNKRIQELQAKNRTYEEQLNSITIKGEDIQFSSRLMADLENHATEKKEQRELDMTTLRGKAQVMGLFSKALKKIGITPEAVFRVADFAYKNYVESDYFREVVGKMRLGLSQKEISCLIFIFDEFYSGFITRDDFANSLSAYKVGAQNPHHPYIQECALKLSQLLHSDKVNLIKFYEEMESRGKTKTANSALRRSIDLNLFQEHLKQQYPNKISDREIVAAFNAIDLESVGQLEKKNFLYCITSYINKLLSSQEVSRKTHQEWSNVKSQYQNQEIPPLPEAAKTTPKRIQRENHHNEQSSVNPYTPSPSEGLLQRLNLEFKVSLFAIYQELLMDPLSSRMTMKSFKKHLLALNPNIPHTLLNDFFREIDTHTRGSIYFSELASYYLNHSQDPEIIFRLIGKYLYRNDLDAEKFWFMFGLTPDSEISKGRFLELVGKTFESKNEKVWEGIWGVFDKGRGSCNVGSLVRTLKKYEIE